MTATCWRSRAPDHLRGRVIAVLGVVSAAAGALGGPLLGYLSDTLGPRIALQLAGVVTVIATLIATAAFARLHGIRPGLAVRRWRRPEPAVTPDPAASPTA